MTNATLLVNMLFIYKWKIKRILFMIYIEVNVVKSINGSDCWFVFTMENSSTSGKFQLISRQLFYPLSPAIQK